MQPGDTQPGRRELTADELTSVVDQILTMTDSAFPKLGDFEVTPNSIDDKSLNTLQSLVAQRRVDLANGQPPLVAPEPEPEEVPVSHVPEGFEFIGLVFEGRFDGENRLVQNNLLANHRLDEIPNGVSLCMNRTSGDQGYLTGRIIHDMQGKVYVYRRDDHATDTTIYRVRFSHQGYTE